MAYDLGDVIPLSVTVRNAAKVPENATLGQYTITKPDGTVDGPTTIAGVAGVYNYDYTAATQVGRYAVRFLATGTNQCAVYDVFDVIDPLSELPIVSLEDAKAQLLIPSTDTTRDDQVRTMLATASTHVERYCNASFRRQSITRSFNGGACTVPLTAPVLSVTSVTVDGVALAATDYELDANAGLLWRGKSYNGLVWSPGAGNVSVTWVAGYANPPLPVVQGVLELLSHLWESRQGTVPRFGAGGSIDPADAGNGSLTFLVPYRVREMLDPYVRPGIG
jgi:hypothetical protein